MRISLNKRIVSLFVGIFVFMSCLLLVNNLKAEVFKATAYCSCKKCCDKDPTDKWYGITATGSKAKWGTVAVDKNVIKLGSKLRIEGFPGTIFKAEDVGGAIKGKHIDVWFPTHEDALNFGVQKRAVRLVRSG